MLLFSQRKAAIIGMAMMVMVTTMMMMMMMGMGMVMKSVLAIGRLISW